MLLRKRLMTVEPAPLGDRRERPPETTGSRALLHHPDTLPRPAPVVGEAQEVETPRLGTIAGVRTVGPVWWLECQQPGLVGMDRQPVPAKTLWQHLQHPPSVFFTGKAYDEVVRITDEESTSLQPRLDLLLEPHVQHVVQIDVGQKRRNHTALRGALVRKREAAVFEHSRIEPFSDQSQQHPVAYPLPKQVPQVSMIQRVEELADVHFHDPATSHTHRLPPKTVQRLMRRPSGPKAVRARTEVLLIDRFEHHDDRPLEDLVLESRDADRP